MEQKKLQLETAQKREEELQEAVDKARSALDDAAMVVQSRESEFQATQQELVDVEKK